MTKYIVVLFSLFLTTLGFAQVAAPDVDTTQVLSQLMTFIGGIKGASALAIAAGATQLIMYFFRSPLANFAGKYRLLIVSGLTIVIAVLSNLVTGQSLIAALLNGAVLSAIQVFAHQLITQPTVEAPKA